MRSLCLRNVLTFNNPLIKRKKKRVYMMKLPKNLSIATGLFYKTLKNIIILNINEDKFIIHYININK